MSEDGGLAMVDYGNLLSPAGSLFTAEAQAMGLESGDELVLSMQRISVSFHPTHANPCAYRVICTRRRARRQQRSPRSRKLRRNTTAVAVAAYCEGIADCNETSWTDLTPQQQSGLAEDIVATVPLSLTAA